MAHSERRIERLDEFFLFITSVLGVFFSLLYTLLGYQEVVYGFLPLLIIGLVIPIYIGYVRGAILLDMLEERVRGWIYFLIGVIYYFASIIFLVVNKLLLLLNVEFEILSGLIGFAGMLLVAYFLGWRRLYRWFCRNIFKAFNHEMTELTDKIYIETSASAFYTSLLFYCAFSFSLSENLDVVVALMIIFCVLMGATLFTLYERDIRKWVSLVRFSNFIEIESKKAMPSISIRAGKLSFLFFIIIGAILSVLSKWLPLPVTLGLFIILASCAIFSNLSFETKYTPMKKKDVPKEIEMELTELIDCITKKKEKSKGKGYGKVAR